MDSVLYTTPRCPHCKSSSKLLISKEGLAQWQAGSYVQDAFPSLNDNQRELLKTGFHPECWNIVFGGKDF